MRYALIIALVVICVIGVAGVAYFAGRVYDTPDPLAAQKLELDKLTLTARIERLRIEQEAEKRKTAVTLATLTRQRRIAAARPVETAEIALAVFLRTLPMIALTLAVVGATGYYALRKIPFEYGEVKTYLPARAVPLMTERALIVAGLSEQARIAAYEETLSRARVADAALLFKSLRSGRETTHITQETPALLAAPQAAPAPSFADMLHAGKFADGKPLVFGFHEDGQPKTGTWDDAYSLGIAGLSGYGKTNTMRLLIAESLLTGAVDRFYVLDPHYPHPKSLLASLGDLKASPRIRYAENPLDTPDLLAELHDTIDRRLALKEPSTPIICLVVDELIQTVKKHPQIAEIVERIGTESRKAGVYGMFAAQSWNADRTGGTTARDNLTALFVHRMKRKQAQTLLQDADLTRLVTQLDKGQVLFAPVADAAQILTVPFCAVEDMPQVVSRLGAGTSQAATGTTQAVKPSVDTGADVDAPEANVGADVIDFAARREQRGNTTPTVSFEKQPDTGAFPPLPQDALAAQLREYLQTQDMSLSKFADAAGVNKGLLSVFLRGEKRLSESMSEKVTAAMRGEKREVTV